MKQQDRIREWVKREFPERLVDRVTDDLIDAASEGPTIPFERSALVAIFGDDPGSIYYQG